jgi:hypothetical protein
VELFIVTWLLYLVPFLLVAVPVWFFGRRRVRITMLFLIWVGCWFVSVASFYIQKGFLPHGAIELWVGPLMFAVVTLPLSFGGELWGLFQWLPAHCDGTVILLAAIAFWPTNITFVVLALRMGKWMYFVTLGVINLLASVYWHVITWNGLNG